MKTKPTSNPMTVDAACFALQDALSRQAKSLAGSGAWSAPDLGLEDDVDTLTNELWETVTLYEVAVTKLAHRAAAKFEAVQKRERKSIVTAKPKASRLTTAIVTARNPRKLRRDGATR